MSTEHLILPVGTRVALIDIMFVGMTVFIVKVSRIGALLAGILILHQYKFIRVHHIQFVGKRLGLYIGIQADMGNKERTDFAQ
jgi:predicted membrane protein